MNRLQRLLLIVFLPMTALLLILDNVLPGANMVKYIKFATIITLFLLTLNTKKRHREQALLSWAIFFIVVGDFFLVFCSTIPGLANKAVPFGILAFSLAYIYLTLAFQKNFSLGWKELAATIPVLAIYIPNFLLIFPHISGAMLWGLITFSFVLCYMTWSSICTMFRGYYRAEVARRLALAGYLMLICDMGVANAIFNPDFAGSFVPWLENIIWASYIPGWTLIGVTIAEEKFTSL